MRLEVGTSENAVADESNDCRLRREFSDLWPLGRGPDRLSRLAAIWLRELPIHWIGVQGKEVEAPLLRTSIEERRLEPGRLSEGGSPSPAIHSEEWDQARLEEIFAEGMPIVLGRVRLERGAAESERGKELLGLTEWLYRKSEEWESELLAAKLESLAEFSAGAGHEINNPLATITGRVQLLLMKEQDPGRRQMLEIIGGQALRIRDMIGDVMLFARPPEGISERIVLREWIPTMLPRFEEQAVKQKTELQLEISEGIELWGDRTQAAVALGALLQNSLNALGKGGAIRIRAEGLKEGDRIFPGVRICVEDDGPGLTALEREHLFDPFFSGRQAGRGLGFGLTKAWRIVTRHGGEIRVEERHPKGLRMLIDWPARPDELKDSGEEAGSESPVV